MTDTTFAGLFWAIAIPTLFLLVLIVGAVWVECVQPRTREWIRALRAREAGRRAQGRL